MVNARFLAKLPRKVLVQAEDKSFQIEWLRQASKGEEVDLQERSKGGTFMEEPNGSITGTVEANGRGDFLRFVVFNRSAGKFRTICFPAGFKGQVWSLLGSQIRGMLDIERKEEEDYQAPPSFMQNQSQ
ncbi:hypothetical protein FRX31_021734 [Thalictrum thalictroides]|uniref:Uncharacterized protein n=1 Tax=Thalictrum thalictroides TaxID=46969 RepID=A0A7J6VWY0_THATH|nr:hypothetical protein FRX31_021734 [Thalictrum thalictroides]